MPDVCPYCGSASTGTTPPTSGSSRTHTDPLVAEISRIREIAQSRQASAERETIEHLSQEVVKLRETVARLRGSTAAHPHASEASALSAPQA